MFPRIPRCHFRRLAPIVRDFCQEHGLDYQIYTFTHGNQIVLGVLKDVAMQMRFLWKSSQLDGRFKGVHDGVSMDAKKVR